MKDLSFTTFTPPPPSPGLIQRVAAALKNITADSAPTLRRLAAAAFGKVPTPAAVPDAKQTPSRPTNEAPAAPAAAPGPPKPDPVLDGWPAAERAELAEMESYLASLQTEDERDKFTAGLVKDIKATIKASGPPPAAMKHDDFRKLPFGEANAFMREGGKLVP